MKLEEDVETYSTISDAPYELVEVHLSLPDDCHIVTGPAVPEGAGYSWIILDEDDETVLFEGAFWFWNAHSAIQHCRTTMRMSEAMKNGLRKERK